LVCLPLSDRGRSGSDAPEATGSEDPETLPEVYN